MTIEAGIENAGAYLDTLDDTYPAGGDDLVEGDNHIRGIKNCILNTFPSITGAVTSTHTELNILDGVTATATEINYLDKASALGTTEASKAVTADASRDVTNLGVVTADSFVGPLTGNADTATTATTAANLSGSNLGGDVTNSGNTITIAAGAVETSMLESAEQMTTSNVLGATAGVLAGDLGSYALLTDPASTTRATGSTLAGASLRYTDVADDNGAAPGGTWRCMGYALNGSGTVWARIL